jgi:hypothetical protein
MSEYKPVLLPDPKVAKRYGVSTRTLPRWDKTPGVGFPPPIIIRDRKYRDVAKLEQWDLDNAQRAAAAAEHRKQTEAA